MSKKFSWNRRGSYCKEEWLEEFLESKGAFYNGNESDNNDESYNENNEQQQLAGGFTISCYKIVSPILQKLINDFAIFKHQKHCSGILLLAEDISHGFVNQNYIFQNRTTHFHDQPRTCCNFMLCWIKFTILH